MLLFKLMIVVIVIAIVAFAWGIVKLEERYYKPKK